MRPGTYVLALSVPRSAQVGVGALGIVSFERGVYLYVGSARGPGGLSARLRRHAGPVERLHWHVDYLRRVALPILAFVSYDAKRLECAWARSLESQAESAASAKGFGASDCACLSHLFFAGSRADFAAAVEPLRRSIGADEIWPLAGAGCR